MTIRLGSGYSHSNLNYMRMFFQAHPILETVSPKLSWGHWFEILKISDPLERSFYQRQTEHEGWGVRELKRQKKSMLFHRLATSKDKEGILRSQYLLNQARFRQSAALEQIDFASNRQGLNRAGILQLASCNFIHRGEHVLITGPTGVGKSFLATALGNTACLKGFKVLFTSTAKLLTQLLNDKADGTYLKKLNQITRHNLLILDDFGLHPFQEADQLILYDLIEDMTHKHALILTSQIPVEHWHQLITQSTLADAVMDRIIHNAHRIELKGDSMRKTTIVKD